MTTTLPKYHHVPLEAARSIRVLELHPAPSISAPIRCSLKAVSLNNYPEWHAHYTALSYTWDGQSPSCEVDSDGFGLLITPNCDSAMRHLRHATETCVLWIDSICIDQSPEAVLERNQQVALMGEIYKSAAKVVIWLGPGNERVESAMRQMMDIACTPQRMGISADVASRRIAQEAIRQRVVSISEGVTKPSEDPIGPIFECSWFYRMWTLQEATLSSLNRTYLRCGTLEIPWGAFIIAVDALKTGRYQWGRWSEAMRLQQQFITYLMVKRIPGAKAILDDNRGNIHNTPLVFAILENTRKKLATNPKDKIVALYGLFQELEIPFPAPDYSLRIEDIYREATAASINYDKNLYILYHAPSDRRRAELASWVPDWAENGFDRTDARYGILRDRFAASGPGEPQWRFSHDNKQLILRGKVVDTVIFKADAMPDIGSLVVEMRNRDDRELIHDSIFRNVRTAASVFRTWVDVSKWADYPTGESSKEALQRTLVLDNPENNAIASTDNAFNEWYDSLDLQCSSVDLVTLSMLRNLFHNLAVLSSSKKCFFYTENCYFGTAPDPLPMSMEAGDKVAIVSGLEMPLLLRPVEADGGYKLISHAYVHGMMYGELWPDSEHELQDIVLL